MTFNFNKESKIYVAGHRGLVGSAILDLLKKRGYQNLIYREKEQLDLRRQAEVEAFFNKEKPEFLFIAAAKVGGILANKTYKAEFIYDNLAISSNLINSAYSCGVKKLINLGSSCIYPADAPQPLKEEYLLTGKPEKTNEPYAIAKIAGLKLCQFYNEQYGTDYLTLMPPNLYGLNDKFNLETSHFIPAILRKFALARALQDNNFIFIKKDLVLHPIGFGLDYNLDLTRIEKIEELLEKLGITREYIKLWGSGKPRREFLAVEDLADAMLYFMENVSFRDSGEFVNIGYQRDYTIAEAADIMKKITDYKGEIVFDETYPDGVFQKKLNTIKAERLGWKPKIKFEDGLQRLYSSVLKKIGEIMTTKEILEKYKTIVVYGMSTNPAKPANEVPHYMMARGYKIIPLNPMTEEIDGLKCYKSLKDIPDEIDILDVFRRSEDCLAVVEEAVERRNSRGDIKVIWLQLGIINNEAKKLAEENGIEFIQDKCIKIEYNINF